MLNFHLTIDSVGQPKLEFPSSESPYLDVNRPFKKRHYTETKADLTTLRASIIKTTARTRSHFRALNLAGPKHIALIACSASKTTKRTCAKDLYTGNLFRKAKAYAETRCDGFFILSALHGLLSPTQEIEPYDQTMAQMNRHSRDAWAQHVVSSIIWNVPRSTITLLAGNAYCEPIHQQLQAAGFLLKRPLKSLAIGQQQRRLMDMLAESELE
jgi:cytoplasmic iron level regulating protein YaaA (DUF328/UPF0246 family)